jgi:hypothetical protein
MNKSIVIRLSTIILSFMAWGVAKPSDAAVLCEESSSPDADSYSLQADGSCEGIVDSIGGETNSGPFRITSFSLGSLDRIDDNLKLRIPKFSSGIPEFRLQAIQAKYQMAFELASGVVERVISTSKMRKRVSASELRSLAWIKTGNQFSYVPLLYNQSANRYDFSFYSQKPVEISNIRIVRQSDQKVVQKCPNRSLQSSSEIAFSWDNPKKHKRGQYQLRMSITLEGKSAKNMAFDFSHDSQWFQ